MFTYRQASKTIILLLFAALGLNGNTFAASKEAVAEAAPKVILSTTFGDITIELFPKKSPASVRNFLQYVDRGFYDGALFHRVIPGFMIQAGGFQSGLTRIANTQAPIRNESRNGLHNSRGTVAMARTNDPHSATSQFFINTQTNDYLDGTAAKLGYAVFGRVTSGMDVVDKISNQPTLTAANGMRNVPRDDIKILSASRVSK